MKRRSIAYSASPLLASRTPVWRSRFILAVLAAAFLGLAGRAVYVQVLDNDFFQRQGEARFARNIELPPSRGRILDRNGLILASSVAAYGIWADGADAKHPALGALANLLDMPKSALDKRIARSSDGFVYLKRQVSPRDTQQDQGARYQRRFRYQGVQARVPRGRGGGPCGRLHQYRGQGHRRC